MSLSDDDIFCILINVASLSQNFLDPKRKLKLPSFVSVLRLRTKKNIYIYIYMHGWHACQGSHNTNQCGVDWNGLECWLCGLLAAGCWLLAAGTACCLLAAGGTAGCWLLAIACGESGNALGSRAGELRLGELGSWAWGSRWALV